MLNLRLALPHRLALVCATLGAAAAACNAQPAPDVLTEAAVGPNDAPLAPDAPALDAVAALDATDDYVPRLCVPGPGPDGSAELRYTDGGLAGYQWFFADGASETRYPDGAFGGATRTDENGELLLLGGPCDHIV